jgi:hypothetical protein
MDTFSPAPYQAPISPSEASAKEDPKLPKEFQPSHVQKVTDTIARRAPFILDRLFSRMMYGVFQLIRFLIQVIHDAIG